MSTLQLTQEPVQCVMLLGFFELADQVGGREKSNPQTGTARRLTQRNSNMCFASSMTADKATIVFLFNPLTSCQLQDLRLGKLGHDAEIVGVEILQHGELGVLDPGRNRIGVARRQFGLGESEQELDETLIGRSGVPRQRSNSRPIVGSRNCRK